MVKFQEKWLSENLENKAAVYNLFKFNEAILGQLEVGELLKCYSYAVKIMYPELANWNIDEIKASYKLLTQKMLHSDDLYTDIAALLYRFYDKHGFNKHKEQVFKYVTFGFNKKLTVSKVEALIKIIGIEKNKGH